MIEDLGARLRTARKAGGITQVAVVATTGISQARLSRIENGRALPSEQETTALAALFDMSPTETEQALQLTRDAAAEIRDSRLVVQRGNTLALQERWRAMENASAVVRSYQPAIVLGGLQIAAYAAVVMQEPEDSAVVLDRMRRQDRLRDTGHRLIAIQTEGALRRTVGSRAVMAAQIAHLAELSSSPNVSLGVIPDDVPSNMAVSAGFHIYDDSEVVVGLDISAAILAQPDDVAYFRGRFAALEELAVFEDEARHVLQRVAGLYR